VRLELLDLAGKKVEKEVARTGFHDIRNRPALEWCLMQPGNIGYVALNDFGTHELIKEWDQTLPKLLGTAALVLDVRLNSGGSSGIGYHVLQSLVDKPFLTSRQVMRRYNPTERARGSLMEWTEIPAGEIEPGDGARYLKPVVVLTGPATFSAAEDFLVALKNSKRGTIIGEPSGGSTGQPLFFKLPGGGSARVCTKRDTFPDGREWVGKGIDPEIVVRPLFSDVRAGRDTVLEKALEYARSNTH
jgi:carboxyl-terminal processing protease